MFLKQTLVLVEPALGDLVVEGFELRWDGPCVWSAGAGRQGKPLPGGRMLVGQNRVDGLVRLESGRIRSGRAARRFKAD